MKRNPKFMLWLFAALMFCVVVSGGCGGGSSNDTPAAEAPVSDDVTPISDDVTGRGEDWEELTAFDIFPNIAWKITDVKFIGQGVQSVEYDKESMGFYGTVMFNVSNYTAKGGTESATLTTNYEHTLDFHVTIRNDKYSPYWFMNEMLVGNGYFSKYGNFFMTYPSSGNYYMIEMVSPTKLIFTSTRYSENSVLKNHQVVTTLELYHYISPDNDDDDDYGYHEEDIL